MSKFMLYYHYENLSLIDSAAALFKRLDIDVVSDNLFKYHGGHWGWLVNEQKFFTAQAYNIAKAAQESRDLLVLEEDAYINLVFAKKHIDENPVLLNAVESELSRQNLTYSPNTKIIYLTDLLLEHSHRIQALLKSDFSNFSVSVVHSSRHKQESSLPRILEMLNLKIAHEEHCAFFQNELFSPQLAYKYSARALERALDSGSDFVLCQSMGVFEMFDKKRKQLSHAINRDLSRIATLFLPQVVLLACGIRDDVELAVRYHKFAPDFY